MPPASEKPRYQGYQFTPQDTSWIDEEPVYEPQNCYDADAEWVF